MVGLDHLGDELDDRDRREELATLLQRARCEVAEEVLVDAPEEVAVGVSRDGAEGLE